MDYISKYNSLDILYHHGIKGQKWGVRRFQNKDGSLTSAGKKHAAEGSQPRTMKGNAHRALAKVYSLNEKTYSKMGNKTMASMNRHAKNAQLKKAEEADAKGKTGLSDKQKKAVKVGAAVAGTALAAYGAYKFSKWVDSENVKLAEKAGKEFGTQFFNDMKPKNGITGHYSFNEMHKRAAATIGAQTAGDIVNKYTTGAFTQINKGASAPTRIKRAFDSRAISKGKKSARDVYDYNKTIGSMLAVAKDQPNSPFARSVRQASGGSADIGKLASQYLEKRKVRKR